ncbi:hypothetical protein B0O99DRAFT_693075 [Bisporella sp. PMI_857]|nr:hypothetical protein B0O99DRAFT_693075 [Bisporella sp. PMI_857]
MSKPEPDQEPRSTVPKHENPFIKFRQFADDKVSTLLQGIIGLPSALSRAPSSNVRWADFDDDFRRRDELQVRQRELKEAEATNTKYSGNNGGSGSIGENSTHDGTANSRTSNERAARVIEDLPLYSQGIRELLADLGPNGDGISGWSLLLPSRDSGRPTDPLATVRHHIFMQPNLPGYGGSLSSESGNTLLPYLLFSPYSPLKLSASTMASRSPKDDFPYCEAFEDLLRTSFPQASRGPRYVFGAPPNRAVQYVSYIDHLKSAGLLEFPKPIHTHFREHNIPAKIGRESLAKTWEQEHDAQTEQDAYDRYEQQKVDEHHAVDLLDSLLKDIYREFHSWKPEAERVVRTAFDELKSSESESERNIGSIMESLFNSVSSKKMDDRQRDFQSFVDEMFKDLEPYSRKDVQTTSKFEADWKSGDEPHSDKVVSTSTTSERTTNEDGSIETRVTVWKRFADGREAVTTTSHVEDPGKESEGQPAEQVSAPEAKKSEKKGWFWN